MVNLRNMKKLSAYPTYLILSGVAAFIFSSIFTVDLVYQVTVVRLDPLQLVLVGTVLEGTVFLFEVPTGVVADVYSRRLSVIIGWFLIGAGFVLEGSLPLFGAILLAQVLWGLGYTFTSGATDAWIADEVGEIEAGRAFLRGAQVDQIGSLIGVGAAVVLGSLAINLPIVAGGFAFVGLGVFLAVFMPETGFKPRPKTERNSWRSLANTFRSGARSVRARPVLITILIIGAIGGAASESFDRLWRKHLLDTFTFPALGSLQPVVWFGIIDAVAMLLSIAATEIVRRKVNTRQPRSVARTLLAADSVLMLGVIGFSLANRFELALISFWCVAVLRHVESPVYLAWINTYVESEVRATVLSMSSQANALGQIAGGPILGAAGSRFGVRTAIALGGVLLSPALALYARVLRHDATRPRLQPLEPQI